MQSFILNSHEVFIHIHQGCFAGTGAIVRLPQCQWSKPDGYGKISQCITTTKHSKAVTVCIFLGMYCRWLIWLYAHNCFDVVVNFQLSLKITKHYLTYVNINLVFKAYIIKYDKFEYCNWLYKVLCIVSDIRLKTKYTLTTWKLNMANWLDWLDCLDTQCIWVLYYYHRWHLALITKCVSEPHHN